MNLELPKALFVNCGNDFKWQQVLDGIVLTDLTAMKVIKKSYMSKNHQINAAKHKA